MNKESEKAMRSRLWEEGLSKEIPRSLMRVIQNPDCIHTKEDRVKFLESVESFETDLAKWETEVLVFSCTYQKDMFIDPPKKG